MTIEPNSTYCMKNECLVQFNLLSENDTCTFILSAIYMTGIGEVDSLYITLPSIGLSILFFMLKFFLP